MTLDFIIVEAKSKIAGIRYVGILSTPQGRKSYCGTNSLVTLGGKVKFMFPEEKWGEVEDALHADGAWQGIIEGTDHELYSLQARFEQ